LQIEANAFILCDETGGKDERNGGSRDEWFPFAMALSLDMVSAVDRRVVCVGIYRVHEVMCHLQTSLWASDIDEAPPFTANDIAVTGIGKRTFERYDTVVSKLIHVALFIRTHGGSSRQGNWNLDFSSCEFN
jgi:hypothetical protein